LKLGLQDTHQSVLCWHATLEWADLPRQAPGHRDSARASPGAGDSRKAGTAKTAEARLRFYWHDSLWCLWSYGDSGAQGEPPWVPLHLLSLYQAQARRTMPATLD